MRVYRKRGDEKRVSDCTLINKEDYFFTTTTMDFCRNRNITVPGGLPSEYQQEQLLSPSCSHPGSLDDLFSTHNTTEGDVNLEWLSIFVEDCFSSSGNCITVPPVAVPAGIRNELQETPNNGINTASTNKMALQLETKAPIKQQQNASSLPKFVNIPGKARSKRKRGHVVLTKPKSQTQFTSWWSHHRNRINEGNPLDAISHSCSSDHPLLQQAYWLADSELILPKKEDEDEDQDESEDIYNRSNSNERIKMKKMRGEGEEEEKEEVMGKKNTYTSSSNGQQQQGRRCSHCLAQRTPQWRAGPMGPKTLCNACGVRYKSGRLLPEYRPAKSPTFVGYKHSNSHKKVMEMRMALPSSTPG
ncbi:hypothetical protein U1Q18_012682 [Sarracenia purpurea var. burkii]